MSKTRHTYSTNPREYSSWAQMKNRCNNPKDPNYKRYGGRGISICSEWNSLHGFKQFYIDMGPRPQGKTLDRINNDGNYEPSNCKWSTRLEQANNTRTNYYLAIDGVTRTLAQWTRYFGVDKKIVYRRRTAGWPDKQLFTPKRKKMRMF